MALTPSLKTANFEVPYAAGSDSPPDVPALSKAVAERVNAILKSVKGDATLATDGTLTLAAARKPVTWYTPKIIAPEETRENTAFGTLATKDEITNIVVPAGGYIEVGFLALIKSSVASAGRVGLFLGGNNILSPGGLGEAGTSGTGYFVFTTAPEPGTIARSSTTTLPTAIAIATVRVYIATPGTYALSVQYKATSGSVSAKERTLWAEVHGF